MQQAEAQRRRRRILILLSLLSYFLVLSLERITYRFSADDMMNMGIYFQLGPWRALESQFLVWRGFYRPLAAAFYIPLHHWFGLNPAPFQIAILCILAANLVLFFYLAIALGCDDLTAVLASLIVAYHAGLSNLQYGIDMIYDVLCFSFFIGTLLYYVTIRTRAAALTWPQTAVFFLLYLCALNGKEMALTLPGVLIAYEFFYVYPSKKWGSLANWFRGPGIPILLSAILVVLSLYGKKFGVTPLLNRPAYRPVFTLGNFLTFHTASLHDLFGLSFTPTWRGLLALWLVITYLAWRRPRPILRFCWAYMLLTPLPVAFLIGRTQGCLYIPLAGWAIFFSVVFIDVARAAAGALSREPLFRQISPRWLFGALIASGVLLWVNHNSYLKASLVQRAAAVEGVETASVIQQLHELHPTARPGAAVVFLNDPFTDWDMTFIATLWFADRTIHIYNQRLEHLSPAELARMDYVFDFRNGKLVQLR
ncbi:MAG: hypothetical protein JO323_20100 [Acidobacteriia bacterium]|nr:hypothetical protein [Terriglobia bacterium]